MNKAIVPFLVGIAMTLLALLVLQTSRPDQPDPHRYTHAISRAGDNYVFDRQTGTLWIRENVYSDDRSVIMRKWKLSAQGPP